MCELRYLIVINDTNNKVQICIAFGDKTIANELQDLREKIRSRNSEKLKNLMPKI